MNSHTPHPQLARLAQFSVVPLSEAVKTYKLGPFTREIDFEDMFGEPPEFAFVAHGPVTATGDVRIDVSDYVGIYIIDGDLAVDGLLEYTQHDGASVLYVHGSVRAKAVGITDEAQLWIAKDLTLTDLVIDGLSDAGGLHVRGTTTARGLVATRPDSPRKLVKRAVPIVKERALVAAFADDVNAPAMIEALRDAKPVLAVDAPAEPAPTKLPKVATANGKVLQPIRAPTKQLDALKALARWIPIATPAAKKLYDLNAIREATDCVAPKAVYVHPGNLKVAGSLALIESAPDCKAAAYVIDGDLEVDGLLHIDASDGAWGILIVTGNVHVKHLGVVFDGQRWVGGNLEVREMSLSHSYHVAGEARIGTLLYHGRMPHFAHQPIVETLANRDGTAVESYESDWHAKLPKPAVQASLFVSQHARSDMDKLLADLSAGKQISRA